MTDTVTAADEAQLVAYANTQPVLLSLLYDLDLMPEQITQPEERLMMCRIIGVYMLGVAAERTACATLAHGFVASDRVEDGYSDVCDEIAAAIRART